MMCNDLAVIFKDRTEKIFTHVTNFKIATFGRTPLLIVTFDTGYDAIINMDEVLMYGRPFDLEE